MKNKKSLLFRLLTVLILLILAGTMFIIGRGHTVYFDNKTLEINGTSHSSFYKVIVRSGNSEIATLMKRERGMMTTIGQNLTFSLEVLRQKDSQPELHDVRLNLPYHLDGIVLNLPALLAGEAQETYLSEFIPLVTEPEPEEEIQTEDLIPTDF